MKILLQFPEGLKEKGIKIAERMEKKGNEVFISSSPCYGGCDLALEEAKVCAVNKIIHFGHSKFVSAPINVEYIEYPIKIKYKRILKKSLSFLQNYHRIGLLTTLQHIHQLSEIKKFFEKNGKSVFIGKGKKVKYHGQILGCDTGSAKSIENNVECFIYFGGGLFHPLSLRVNQPILKIDPFLKEVKWLNEEMKILKRKRRFVIGRGREAKIFGILVSTKLGQFNLDKAKKIKKLLERKGKKAFILISNNISWESLENFVHFDCFINTACPRLSEDYSKKPILNYEEGIELVKLI